MKPRWVLAMLVLVLAGCGEYAGLGGGRCRWGLCVKIEVMEPVRWGEAVTVIISVTATQDIPDLGVWPNHDPGVIVEGPEDWEVEARDRKIGERAASWKVDVKANRRFVFVRRVRLPEREGEFKLSAAVYRSDWGYISDPVSIYLTREGGVVNPTPAVFSGTPELVPTIPAEWLGTPFPTPTPLPTLPPSPLATPTHEEAPFRSPLPTPVSVEHP